MKIILNIVYLILICIAIMRPSPARAKEYAPPRLPGQVTGNRDLPDPMIASTSTGLNQSANSALTPIGGPPIAAVLASEAAALQAFARSVTDETRAGLVTGLFAPGTFAAPVVQQPYNNPVYVSTQADQLTQFRTAERAGSIGLLAHNYLLGKDFFKLEVGAWLHVVYANGRSRAYQVYAIKDYEALSMYTFRELGSQASIDQYPLFDQLYRADDRVVLQTCIQKGNNLSWGRRFILAGPVPFQELLLERKDALISRDLLP
jgi:hypothetical protein